NGEWLNTGTRNDSSDANGDSSYESDSNFSSAQQQTSTATGTSNISYDIEENGNEHFTSRSSSQSLLDATGGWQLTSGDATTTTNGTSHFKSTGTGSYTAVVHGGTVSGEVDLHETVRDSNFSFT